MGLGRFSECGLVYCLLWLRKWINIKSPYSSPSSLLTTICACQQSLPEWERCIIIGLSACAMGLSTVPACQPCKKCASMPEGHPEVSVLPWTFPRGPRCPEGQDIVPLCQLAQTSQDCTYGSDSFVMMIFDCFILSCDILLAVFVTIYCFKVYNIDYFE